MNRWTTIVLCFLAVIIAVSLAYNDQRQKRRDLDAKVFAEMRKNPWNLNGDLLWGYYFTNSARWPLEMDGWILRQIGYRTVEIYPAEKGDFLWLHVERVERLDLDSIAGRNVRFAWFARAFGLSTYDGWDVGQVNKPREANKLPLPTPAVVTPAAGAPVAPPSGAADR